MKCIHCGSNLYINEWEGWFWWCPMCDELYNKASAEEIEFYEKQQRFQIQEEFMAEKINIKYFNDKLEKIRSINIGDWTDLRSADDVVMTNGDFKVIPLGIAMQLPEGYEAHVVPRSSTFKNFGIIQANSMGIIDNSYRGDGDQWFFPAICLRPNSVIKFNDRICQFRIIKKQPKVTFMEYEKFNTEDRGGFGSTGIK